MASVLLSHSTIDIPANTRTHRWAAGISDINESYASNCLTFIFMKFISTAAARIVFIIIIKVYASPATTTKAWLRSIDDSSLIRIRAWVCVETPNSSDRMPVSRSAYSIPWFGARIGGGLLICRRFLFQFILISNYDFGGRGFSNEVYYWLQFSTLTDKRKLQNVSTKIVSAHLWASLAFFNPLISRFGPKRHCINRKLTDNNV